MHSGRCPPPGGCGHGVLRRAPRPAPRGDEPPDRRGLRAHGRGGRPEPGRLSPPGCLHAPGHGPRPRF
ncbi:MAG: hypothetical protein F4Z29_08850 [Gemmatimonadetes bacterium]|nr:hypothetical protein [Gemmatimonadota bacterium]